MTSFIVDLIVLFQMLAIYPVAAFLMQQLRHDYALILACGISVIDIAMLILLAIAIRRDKRRGVVRVLHTVFFVVVLCLAIFHSYGLYHLLNKFYLYEINLPLGRVRFFYGMARS